MVKKGKKRICVTLPAQVVDLLKLRAKEKHISASNQILKILRNYPAWHISYYELDKLGIVHFTFDDDCVDLTPGLKKLGCK